MYFFTQVNGKIGFVRAAIILTLLSIFAPVNFLRAQTSTNTAPMLINVQGTNDATGLLLSTNAPAGAPDVAPTPASPQEASPSASSAVAAPSTEDSSARASSSGWLVLGALFAIGSSAGFLLYQCGLTRAKNCGHTTTLLLVGAVFALTGYWMGGFAVQTGGIADAHAALALAIPHLEKSGLDHELGFMAGGHYWGLMGSSGFFLAADPGATSALCGLFLTQAALLSIAIAAALGAALERTRIMAAAAGAFLIGALVYPLVANWVWGGGWLAELGREFGLGHGFLDLGGAGAIHETAGTLALVMAMVLGPRHGRFGKKANPFPGHNMPFVIVGAVVLLICWTGLNAALSPTAAAVAATNTLLAAMGGVLLSFFVAAWRKQRPEPAVLCRGLLGGAVASSGCSALVDPWAAFVIGAVAAVVIQGAMAFLERRRIDDPVGAASVHGGAGAWGVLATGLFANRAMDSNYNGIDGPVLGVFFGGGTHQLAAQAIGAATIFVVVFILGYACLILIQKIMGARAALSDEVEGLDWSQTGALGYQGDAEPEK